MRLTTEITETTERIPGRSGRGDHSVQDRLVTCVNRRASIPFSPVVSSFPVFCSPWSLFYKPAEGCFFNKVFMPRFA